MTAKTNTEQQTRTLNEVIDFLTKGYLNDYEVKELEVTTSEDWKDVLVSLEIGMAGDEGTMAELICRDHYQFFIGPRGGMFYYPKHSHNARRISKHELGKARW